MDGRDVKVSVQAVPKIAVGGGTYLIMRPVEPMCGREHFTAFLVNPSATVRMESMNLDLVGAWEMVGYGMCDGRREGMIAEGA